MGETFLARHTATLNKIKNLSINEDGRMDIDQAAYSLYHSASVVKHKQGFSLD